MKLEDLIAVGRINDGYKRVTVAWKKTPALDGVDAEIIEFEVLAKREMSSADYEYIYLGTGRQYDQQGQALDVENDGIMARRVHRMCKWPSDDPKVPDKHIPEDTARSFKPGLLIAICEALSDAEASLPTDEDVKKN